MTYNTVLQGYMWILWFKAEEKNPLSLKSQTLFQYSSPYPLTDSWDFVWSMCGSHQDNTPDHRLFAFIQVLWLFLATWRQGFQGRNKTWGFFYVDDGAMESHWKQYIKNPPPSLPFPSSLPPTSKAHACFWANTAPDLLQCMPGKRGQLRTHAGDF